MSLSAPRMWRCFSIKLYHKAHFMVCSTHVEMFLMFPVHYIVGGSLLHACGDVSLGCCLAVPGC